MYFHAKKPPFTSGKRYVIYGLLHNPNISKDLSVGSMKTIISNNRGVSILLTSL